MLTPMTYRPIHSKDSNTESTDTPKLTKQNQEKKKKKKKKEKEKIHPNQSWTTITEVYIPIYVCAPISFYLKKKEIN